MTYTINATKTANKKYDVDVVVKEGNSTILQGHTSVLTADEAEAIAYVENYFLPDIRKMNMDVIGGLELPCDIVPAEEVIEEFEPLEGEV